MQLNIDEIIGRYHELADRDKLAIAAAISRLEIERVSGSIPSRWRISEIFLETEQVDLALADLALDLYLSLVKKAHIY